MAEAIFYLVHSGRARHMPPRHFPPWPTVYSRFFARPRRDGTVRHMHDPLRALAREAERRDPGPSAAIAYSQTVRATGVGGAERGHDSAKRVAGRKRHPLVDAGAGGLVVLAHVHAAVVPDRLGARRLVGTVPTTALPRLEPVWTDGAHTGPFALRLAAERGWGVEIPRHRQRQAWRHGLEEKPKGIHVIPRRWVVERIFAWLSRSRRLARDYERLPETRVATILAALSRIMLRRVAG